MISEQKNKALGRFMDLMMLNLGGYYVKENRMGTYGYLTPFTFAEDEAACQRVGWAPYHVTQGYSLNANTVTAASALNWGNNVTPATDDPYQIMQLMAFDVTEKQQNGLGNTNAQVYRTVLITEAVADDLARGYGTKDSLEDALIETARRPLFMRAYASYWANTGSVQSETYTFEEYYRKLQQDPAEQAALTDTPAWLQGVTEQTQIETIAAMRKGQTPLLIARDGARNKFMVLPGGGYVTVEIQLPENWDALVAPLGYEPLSRFGLKAEDTRVNAAATPAPARATPVPRMETASREQTPGALTDGEYRLVPSMDQMTEAGRIYKSSSGACAAWAYGAEGSVNITMDQGRTDVMKGLYAGCSLTWANGRVTDITLRPAAGTQKNSAAGLTAETLENLRVTLAVVLRQSRQEGKATPDGATMILSARLARFAVELGGVPVPDSANTARFLTLQGSQVTLNPRLEAGATAKIGVQNEDGTWRTLTFTKRDQRTVAVQYESRGSLMR